MTLKSELIRWADARRTRGPSEQWAGHVAAGILKDGAPVRGIVTTRFVFFCLLSVVKVLLKRLDVFCFFSIIFHCFFS